MLLAGKLLGDVVNRLGFSPLIGQMIAGIIVGPMCLHLVSAETEHLELLTNIGILFMMFLMGLSIDIEKVLGGNVYRIAFISILGGTLTFVTTMIITMLLGFPLNSALLVGISFISTSTAIGFIVLSQVGDRSSNVFKLTIALGITDDILAILALSLFMSYIYTGVDVRSAFMLFLLVLGFIIFILSFGKSISGWFIKFSRDSRDEQSIIGLSLILLFFVAFLSQSIGIASVTGAFFAGTILARSPVAYKVITPKISALSEAFFIPLFFVFTGVRIDISEIISSVPIDLMLISIPIDVILFLGLMMAIMASKYFGTFISMRIIGGYKDSEVLKTSLIMTPMGEYTLVIGQIGLITMLNGAPIIDTQIFSVLALVVLVISIISPIMIRAAYQK